MSKILLLLSSVLITSQLFGQDDNYEYYEYKRVIPRFELKKIIYSNLFDVPAVLHTDKKKVCDTFLTAIPYLRDSLRKYGTFGESINVLRIDYTVTVSKKKTRFKSDFTYNNYALRFFDFKFDTLSDLIEEGKISTDSLDSIQYLFDVDFRSRKENRLVIELGKVREDGFKCRFSTIKGTLLLNFKIIEMDKMKLGNKVNDLEYSKFMMVHFLSDLYLHYDYENSTKRFKYFFLYDHE